MIIESIITTQSPDGQVHVAPMGVREENGWVILAPFKPSTTLENILTSQYAVQNFCDDVRVFAGCVTGFKRDWPIVPASKIASVRLRDTLAHSELQLDHIDDDTQRPTLYLKRIHEETHDAFSGFNRAQAAVIEGAVLISRLHLLTQEKIDAEWRYLTIAIEKTAGHNEREAWRWLAEKLSQHRQAKRS
jgi:uncharacterized protein